LHDRERPQRGGGGGHEPLDLVLAGQIGMERRRTAAFSADLRDHLMRRGFGVAKWTPTAHPRLAKSSAIPRPSRLAAPVTMTTGWAAALTGLPRAPS
jgi:hypothetical protein